MTELRITRSCDVELYVGDEQLCGVTYFSASTSRESREIYEYLSGEPYDTASFAESHEIKMNVLSLFVGDVLANDGFTLSVVDGDTVYVYEDCTVISRSKTLDAGKSMADSYVIKARKATKRSVDND